jgi:hypothetical protein
MTLIVHATSDPASLAAAVRSKIHEVDHDQPVDDVATMEERLSQAVAPQRFNALVMALFAAMAVILAAVGGGAAAGVLAMRSTGISMAAAASTSSPLPLPATIGAPSITVGKP